MKTMAITKKIDRMEMVEKNGTEIGENSEKMGPITHFYPWRFPCFHSTSASVGVAGAGRAAPVPFGKSHS